MTDPDFAPARRAAIYQCCGATHALHVPAGFSAFCGHCGRPMLVCNADVRGCGSTPAVPEASAPVVEDVEPPKQETWRDRPPLL